VPCKASCEAVTRQQWPTDRGYLFSRVLYYLPFTSRKPVLLATAVPQIDTSFLPLSTLFSQCGLIQLPPEKRYPVLTATSKMPQTQRTLLQAMLKKIKVYAPHSIFFPKLVTEVLQHTFLSISHKKNKSEALLI